MRRSWVTIIVIALFLVCAGCESEAPESAGADPAESAATEGEAQADEAPSEEGLADRGARVAGELADEGANKAGELADEGSAKAGELADEGKARAGELADLGADKASEWASAGKGLLDEQTDRVADGTMSFTSRSLLKLADTAHDSTRSAAGLVLNGTPSMATVVEIGRALDRMYDSSTRLEPIYQRVDDGEEADATISDMPRTEVVDGVTVGFKDLSLTQTDVRRKEQSVLVLWRRGDHLIGFVYHSESDVHLDVIVKETPRIMSLIAATSSE